MMSERVEGGGDDHPGSDVWQIGHTIPWVESRFRPDTEGLLIQFEDPSPDPRRAFRLRGT